MSVVHRGAAVQILSLDVGPDVLRSRGGVFSLPAGKMQHAGGSFAEPCGLPARPDWLAPDWNV